MFHSNPTIHRLRALQLTERMLIVFLVVLSAPSLYSWDAIWTQGGFEAEKGTEIAIDEEGNVFVAGWATIDATDDTDLVIIKYNNLGVQQWDYVYDGGLHSALGADEPVGIGFDASGNVYAGGKSRFERSGTQDYDYVTIKLDADGVHQWTRFYDFIGGSSAHGDDTATGMKVDSAGNVWITGDSDGEYLTVKYNAAGVEQWAKRYNDDNPSGNHMATAITIDNQGNGYVTGYSMDATAAYQYGTIKYNSAGAEVWDSRYGTGASYGYKPWAIAVDGNGNVAVTGIRIDHSNADWSDIATVQYTANGSQSWAKTFSGTGFEGTYHDEGNAIEFDNDGNVYVAGYATMSGNYTDFILIKYSPAGIQQWMDHYNEVPGSAGAGDSADSAYDVAVDGAGRIYVVGPLDVDWDGYSLDQTYGIVTYSSAGSVLDAQYFNGEPAYPLPDQALAVAVNSAGDVAVTGAANGATTFDDIGTTVNVSDGSIFGDGFESGDLSAW